MANNQQHHQSQRMLINSQSLEENDKKCLSPKAKIQQPAERRRRRRDLMISHITTEQCTKAIFHNSHKCELINLRVLLRKLETFVERMRSSNSEPIKVRISHKNYE